MQTPWRKRLDICLPPLRPRVRVSVIPCGGIWICFPRGFSCFPCTNFNAPFLHTHLIHLVSFRFVRLCDDAVRRVRPASLLFTDLQLRGLITSLPSTGPFRTRVEVLMNTFQTPYIYTFGVILV